jgi:hypothetical protein
MTDDKEIDVHEKHAREAHQSETGKVAEVSHLDLSLHLAFKLYKSPCSNTQSRLPSRCPPSGRHWYC